MEGKELTGLGPKKLEFNGIVSVLLFIYICLTPYLTSYDIPGYSYISLGLCLTYILLKLVKRKVVVNTSLILYISYFVLITLIMRIFINGVETTSLNRMVSEAIHGIVVALMVFNARLIDFVKIYKRFAEFAVMLFLIQLFSYYVLGNAVMFKLPIFQLKEELNWAFRYLETAHSYGMIFARFPGCFSEPSIYAAFVLPLLILYLYSNYKKNLKKIIILCFTIFMSTSGLGIVMMVVEICVFLILEYGKNKRKIIWLPILAIVLLISFLTVYNMNSMVKEMVDTLFVANGTTQSKADYRIFRGLAYYYEMPILNKVFGIGAYNGYSFSTMIEIRTSYDITNVIYEYFNGFSQILIYTGLIGLAMFVLFLLKMYPKQNKAGIGIFVGYLMVIIGTGMLMDGNAMIYLLLLMAVKFHPERIVAITNS